MEDNISHSLKSDLKDSLTLSKDLETLLENHKAQDIVSIDLKGKSSVADFLIIASGTSGRHLNALANYAQMHAKGLGMKGMTIEGSNDSGWVILDLGDVIIHLFMPEIREMYALESMWDPKLYQRDKESDAS